VRETSQQISYRLGHRHNERSAAESKAGDLRTERSAQRGKAGSANAG